MIKKKKKSKTCPIPCATKQTSNYPHACKAKTREKRKALTKHCTQLWYATNYDALPTAVIRCRKRPFYQSAYVSVCFASFQRPTSTIMTQATANMKCNGRRSCWWSKNWIFSHELVFSFISVSNNFNFEFNFSLEPFQRWAINSEGSDRRG